jgi:hypothetical protein
MNSSRRAPPQERWLLPVLALGVVAWWGWPLLDPRHVGWDGDSLCLFLPVMRLAREQLLGGRVPLWNADKFLGQPMLANLMVPFFYPPQLMALVTSQPWGLHAMLVAHAAWAAIGAYYLARRGMQCRPAGATLAGLTFALSAPFLAEVAHPNQLCATAWLPWAWLATLAVGRGRDWIGQGLALGIVGGMMALAGQPQIAFYGAMLCGLTGLGRLAWPGGGAAAVSGERDAEGAASRWRTRWRTLAALALGGALAGGLAAVHFLPALELSHFTSRRMLRSDELSATFALPVANLRTLVLPGAFGAPGTGGYHGAWNFTETAIFLGQAALGLAALGLAMRRRRRLAWLIALVAALGLTLALGERTPVEGWLERLAPVLNQFRAPARAWQLTALALAVAAGWGLDAAAAWAERRGGLGARRACVAALVALQLAGLGWFRFGLMGWSLAKMDVLATPGVAEVIKRASPRPGRLFHLNEEIDYNDVSRAATMAKVARLQPDLNSLAGLRATLGYDEGQLPSALCMGLVWHFWRNIFTPLPDSRLMGLLGIEFLLSDKPIYGDRWRRVGRVGGIDVWRNLDYRGEVFSADDWPDVDLEKIKGMFTSRDKNPRPVDLASAPGTTAVAASSSSSPLSRVEYERLGPGLVRARVPKSWTGPLLLSEGWMPGWEAVGEDGLIVEGKPLNAGLIAFDVPPGAGEWTLRYNPPSFRLGASISGATLAIMLALVLARRRRRARGS